MKISDTDFIKAPKKREKVPSLENPEHKDEKELISTENKALCLNPIFNFGIDSEGRRKDGLPEKLNEYQKISIFMSDDEAKKY
ncbi:MAG: hypothetical protein FJX30_01520 [Alphaproteobacteria bacterium]|nr:hypothetical protein [Alphaproteobacteria bacterium]